MKISNLNNLIKTGSLQLKNWGIIDIIGEKDKVFDLLQGQVTSDVKLLEENECQLSSICNHKGQVMADFIIYCINNSYKFILKDELSDILIQELKPFAQFNFVEFKKSSMNVIGSITHEKCINSYSSNENISTSVDISSSEITSETISENMWEMANKILGNYFLNASDVGKFRPLEINYDKLRVSFDKGCYRGQEIVARMKYLGIDRRVFLTFLTNDSYIDNDEVRIVGKKIEIDNKNVFNGIIKRDSMSKVKKLPGMEEIITITS